VTASVSGVRLYFKPTTLWEECKQFGSALHVSPYRQKWERFYSHENEFIHMGTNLLKFYN